MSDESPSNPIVNIITSAFEAVAKIFLKILYSVFLIVLPYLIFPFYLIVSFLLIYFSSTIWQILGIFSLLCVLIILTPLFIMILYMLDDSSTAFVQFGTRRTWNLFLQLILIITGTTVTLIFIGFSFVCMKNDKITAYTQSIRALTHNETLLSSSANNIVTREAEVVKTIQQEEVKTIFGSHILYQILENSFISFFVKIITLLLVINFIVFCIFFSNTFNQDHLLAIEKINYFIILYFVIDLIVDSRNKSLTRNQKLFLQSLYTEYKTQNGAIILQDVLFGFGAKKELIADFFYPLNLASTPILFDAVANFLKPHFDNQDIIIKNSDIITTANVVNNYQYFMSYKNKCNSVDDIMNIPISAIKGYALLFIQSRFILDEYIISLVIRSHIMGMLSIMRDQSCANIFDNLAYIKDEPILKTKTIYDDKAQNITYSKIILKRINPLIVSVNIYLKNYDNLSKIFKAYGYNIDYKDILDLTYIISDTEQWIIESSTPQVDSLVVIGKCLPVEYFYEKIITDELRNSTNPDSEINNNLDAAQQIFSLIITGLTKFIDSPRNNAIDKMFPTSHTDSAIIQIFKKAQLTENLYKSFKDSLYGSVINLQSKYNEVMENEYDVFSDIQIKNKYKINDDFSSAMSQVKNSSLYKELIKSKDAKALTDIEAKPSATEAKPSATEAKPSATEANPPANTEIKPDAGNKSDLQTNTISLETNGNTIIVTLEDLKNNLTDDKIMNLIVEKHSAMWNDKVKQIGSEFSIEAIVKPILCLRRFNNIGFHIDDINHKWIGHNKFQYRAYMDWYRHNNPNEDAWNINQDSVIKKMLSNLDETSDPS